MIINLISGPRNISTALMYSFAQHPQIKVLDEPFYAFYLANQGVEHPAKEEILNCMPIDKEEVVQNIQRLAQSHSNLFIKNMAHHHEGLELSYLHKMRNVFLIRNPAQLVASFSQIIPNPTLRDIGLKHEADLFDYVKINGNYDPIVVDAADILENPKKQLKRLCKKISLTFDEKMLNWKKGPLPEDGIWARHWYKNVHLSTGFAKQATSSRPLPKYCLDTYEKALPYYEKLKQHV